MRVACMHYRMLSALTIKIWMIVSHFSLFYRQKPHTGGIYKPMHRSQKRKTNSPDRRNIPSPNP